MGTKERPLKGPTQDKRIINKTPISWVTTFSIGINFALAAMMLVRKPPSPALDWIFSKAIQALPRALPHPEHRLKETNGSSAACHNNLRNTNQDQDQQQQLLCVHRPGTPRLSTTASDHVQMCSGNGHFVVAENRGDREGVLNKAGACYCHACFSGVHCGDLDPDCLLNLFHGDPTLFEEYWLAQAATDGATVIPLWQGMSYFAHRHNSFLFVDSFLEQAIRSVHGLVGNAVTEGRFVLLGVGSTQLFQAALYALASPASASQATTSVVSATPHYSGFEGVTKFLYSNRYKWVGDAEKFRREAKDDEPYIELVTSPNNPCGSMNTAVVNGKNGHVVNDLAYYWPHYTPITAPADYPIMLWTLSKVSGHAGTRLGWAIVRDAAVAAKMAYFVQLNTLGVSHDAQQRGITLLRTIMSSYDHPHSPPPTPASASPASAGIRGEHEPANRNRPQPFFHYGQAVLEDRWRRMRQALHNSSRFALPEYDSLECSFLGKSFRANPAFLWLRCTADEDCDQLLKDHKIIARGGPAFGVSSQYVRVSMLDRHPLFNLLLARLASLK